ncbi:GNAT family N-acetyltransferase [Halanaerobium hydrogeniformans]|uniref:GCN5-related N-acetyltransferase n=1 Tax=Halanaerobium hydrogeniformans TaxID=656519 RepID=E4RIY6_HALHG|nr:GNAT family N-acetyltransferase [Halanaerobium hydrogeniformans]ADQ15206.1 GCN5-related N-acetyltransferase [Halanaerobium hydrogeniformans]
MKSSFKFKAVNFLSADYKRIEKLYKKAFPSEQRLPLWFLSLRALKDRVEFLAIYDQSEFIGFFYLVNHQEITFVLYLAVASEHRGKGYGSKVLYELSELKKDQKIILDIESPYEDAANYKQRIKRKKFYLKNNYNFIGLIMEEDKEKYEVLSLQGKEVEEKEYIDLLKDFYTPILFRIFNPKIYSINKNNNQ